MSTYQFTEGRLNKGFWQGVIHCAAGDAPPLGVLHQGQSIDGLQLTARDAESGVWDMSLELPLSLLSDGLQTVLLVDEDATETIGTLHIIAGHALEEDIRSELALLQAELEMLKSAFRRHCREAG